MKISQAWLEMLCKQTFDTQALSHLLTMSGLEVEAIHATANVFNQVIVAKVLSTAQHPNADKLKICQVQINDATAPEVVQIVCGASNVVAGMKVPCALVGATIEMPSGVLAIKKAKLRGEESNGMLCSAKELGISLDGEGLMQLPDDAPIGQCIRQYLNLNDKVLEIKLTPNRADCLSAFGIARELCALNQQTFIPKMIEAQLESFKTPIHVNIARTNHEDAICGGFVGRLVKNIDNTRKTPDCIRQKLEKSGMRSVSLLVDISNFVMLEMGQPSHFFDASKLQGNLTVQTYAHYLKTGGQQTQLALLNGQTVELQANTGLICDEATILALAGVMGGQASSVQNHTQEVYIEVANWFASSIQGQTKQYKLNSDAAYRYERGVDPALPIKAMHRICDLLAQFASTEQTQYGSIEVVQTQTLVPKTIQLRPSRLQKITGLSSNDLPQTLVLQYLNALQFQPNIINDDCIEISVPSYRFDMHLEEDVIEEVLRMHGFDNIPLRMPTATMNLLPLSTSYDQHHFRHKMANLGYSELVNFSFTHSQLQNQLCASLSQAKSEFAIALLNPISEHLDVMRSQLLGGLLQALLNNQRQQLQDVRIFEIGALFYKGHAHNNQPALENTQLTGLVNANYQTWHGQSHKQYDFYHLKADLQQLLTHMPVYFKASINGLNSQNTHYHTLNLHDVCHLGRSAYIYSDAQCTQCIGFAGQLHPALEQNLEIKGETYIFSLDFDLIASKQTVKLQVPSKFSAIERDLAWVVNQDVQSDALIQAIPKKIDDMLITNVHVFDVFKIGEQKSLAIRFYIQPLNNTPNDEALHKAMQSIEQSLAKFGVKRT